MHTKIEMLVILILTFVFLAGCGGNALLRSCETLTEAGEELASVYDQAVIINQQAPALISDEDLFNLMNIRNSLSSITDGICNLGNSLEIE